MLHVGRNDWRDELLRLAGHLATALLLLWLVLASLFALIWPLIMIWLMDAWY